MTQETKVLLTIAITTLLIFIGAIFFIGKLGGPKNTTSIPADQQLLVRPNNHSTGDKDAKVTMVEFGDYQCPGCAQAHPIAKRLSIDFEGKLQFIFRNFPLTQHKNALIAAQAAEAADIQGKFWEMHDILYERQDEWSESNSPMDFFVKYAKDLNLDTEKLKSDIDQKKSADVITQDVNDATKLGVNSTPTFYINGNKVLNSFSYESLKKTIEAELAK